MEMNQDIDSLLLQQFSSMATQDREVLVSELQKVIGNQLNADGCAFFLDMNNWNLQGAICSYFEFYHQETPVVYLPKMALVKDDAVAADGRSDVQTVLPSETFTHTWRIMNTGTEAWPPGCCVRFFTGTQMTSQDRFMVDSLAPGTAIDVRAELTSPGVCGLYRGQWKMSTISGTFFGDLLWVSVQVSDDVSTMFDTSLSLDPVASQPVGSHLPAWINPSDAVTDRSQSFPAISGVYAQMFSANTAATATPTMTTLTDTRQQHITLQPSESSNNDLDTMELS